MALLSLRLNSRTLRLGAFAGSCFVLLHVAVVAIYAAPAFGGGLSLWGGADLLLILASVALAGAALVVGLLALPRKRWLTASASLALALVLLVSWAPTLWVAESLRPWALSGLTKRAQPVVQAVHEYVKQTGAAPKTLEELVPRYLDRLPGGLPSVRMEQYRCPDASWGLTIFVPSAAWLTHEELVYVASENYASCRHGVKPVQNWLYVSFSL